MSGGGGEALADGGAFTAGFGVGEDGDLVAEFGEDFAGFVGAAVVDDDDLFGKGEGEEATDDLTDRRFFVEGRDNDGDVDGFGRGPGHWGGGYLPCICGPFRSKMVFNAAGL